MELSLATRRLKDGVGTLNYEEYLKEMAKSYYYEDNFPKALLYGKEVVDIYEKKFNNNPYKYECVYINALNNLCEYYQRMGKQEEAVSSGMRALELIDNGRCDEYPWLKPAIYNNLGGALINLGKVDEGLSFLETALSARTTDNYTDRRDILSTRIQKASTNLYYKRDTLKALNEYQSILHLIEDSLSVGNRHYPSYATILEKMYELHRWTNPDTALQYLNKAIKIQKEWNGENSIAYANLLLEKVRNIWVPSLSENKNIDSLLFYTRRATDIVKKHINHTAHSMSKYERKRYWQRYKDYFTWLIPTISGIVNMDAGNSLAYDAALFYKGMLLSSEIELKSIIQNSNDDVLYSLYQKYSSHLTEVEKLYSENSTVEAIDSLESLIHEEEFLLSQKVTRFNQKYKGTDFSWKDIRDCLSEEEAAIEIVSYRNIRNDNTYYDAYIVEHRSESPKRIFMCGENELKECFCSDSIDYVRLSSLILGGDELVQELRKYQTLYISPSGLMNSIGIEYLPIEGNRCFSDRFNVYRVSSTREVCDQRILPNYDDVCLFGGLDYESDSQETTGAREQLNSISRAVEESIIQRGGFEPLDGSKIEVERIKEEMTKSGMVKSISLYMDADGDEERFKQLTGNQINILHISTHGMYVSPDNSSLNDNSEFKFMLSGEDSSIDKETQLLTHSFLVMSGGNMLINRDTTQYMKTDNILTALEISHLDFKDLDLVVLSACQTASGENDTDGVYGLQRGFKKAGAKTIVMSLDKVDDEATRILMVEFYRNLMSGKTKLQSLKDAQKHLRQVENGKYDDPKYWASFIMLDGLN